MQEVPLPEAQRSVVLYGSETYPGEDTLYKNSKKPRCLCIGVFILPRVKTYLYNLNNKLNPLVRMAVIRMIYQIASAVSAAFCISMLPVFLTFR